VLLLSSARVARTLDRLAAEIVEDHRGADRLVVFGIRTRGDALGHALARRISTLAGQMVPSHGLDVTPFRDDRPHDANAPQSPLPDVTGRDVLLVDDVLHTGRTIRAALDALVRGGRPRVIRLAVLVDRGAREYPIRADYVGRDLPVQPAERIRIEPAEGFSVYLDAA
jgi:pyrimidine operon attenuation protein / uracil phosphoribosyltransferase